MRSVRELFSISHVNLAYLEVYTPTQISRCHIFFQLPNFSLPSVSSGVIIRVMCPSVCSNSTACGGFDNNWSDIWQGAAQDAEHYFGADEHVNDGALPCFVLVKIL